MALLREKNPTATIVTTPWTELDGKQILETMERRDTLSAELEHLKAEATEEDEDEHEHHHHHHDDEDDHECCCGHHHHHDDDDDDDDDDDHEHEHEHHHDHDEHDHDHCCGHDHDHDDHDHDEHGHDRCCGHHHHHHHADEVFTSWGTETPRKYTDDEIRTALDALINEHRYMESCAARQGHRARDRRRLDPL